MVGEPARSENRGAPLPGFDWTRVQWGAPDARRTEICSYCGDELAEDSVPLIIWNKDGWCAEFCDHCQATWWGCSWDEGPVRPRHEREVLGAVRSCRGCGCTEARACSGGCHWVAEDLCSACAEKNPALLGPGYWLCEITGVLRPAVEHYLRGEPLSPKDVAAFRAYLRQWIAAPAWQGPRVAELRAAIDGLTSRAAFDLWLEIAVDEGLDPL
jgi:hypothetical protein